MADDTLIRGEQPVDRAGFIATHGRNGPHFVPVTRQIQVFAQEPRAIRDRDGTGREPVPGDHAIDDKAGKPVGIYNHIGRRPILAFGNSDGDLQMIEYTTAGEGRRLGLFVHHTDADRESAYDRKSHVGKLDLALDRADANGWIIVDMKNDWKTIFPDE